VQYFKERGWDARMGGLQIDARNLPALRSKLTEGAYTAIMDAWSAPFIWTDLGGQIWVVCVTGSESVGISRIWSYSFPRTLLVRIWCMFVVPDVRQVIGHSRPR